MLVGAVSASPLVHYPNGAAVPYDANNVAATNAHLLVICAITACRN